MKAGPKHIEQGILDELKVEFRIELKRLLEFWGTATPDTKNGGYIGKINHFGKKDDQANKGVVLNARILWTFSAAYRQLRTPELKKNADRAFRYLINHFWDKDKKGLIWEVNYLGEPANTRKQAYAQGFGVYALSEYFLATQNKESLKYAKKLYEILEEKFQDLHYGGYIEALNKDWTKLKDFRLSSKDENLPKSMNTHLHILEPYTNLYQVWPAAKLKRSILNLFELFEARIIHKQTGHLSLFFEMDWQNKSNTISFGHNIEAAWLLHEAAKTIGDHSIIRRAEEIALGLVNKTLQQGVDSDGALFNEQQGSTIDTDKHWWPQAEAMVGLMDAWEIDQQGKYLESIQKVWQFIKNKLIDLENGEWFWRVNRKDIPITSEDKVGKWKCPYHNTRALLELIRRIEK